MVKPPVVKPPVVKPPVPPQPFKRSRYYLDELSEKIKTQKPKNFKIHNLPKMDERLTAKQKYFMKHPIVFTGDSLTDGVGSKHNPYPNMLAQKFKIPIVNTAWSGWKTDDLLANLKERVLDLKPSIVGMTIAGNDLMKLRKSPQLALHMRQSKKVTKINISKIIDAIHLKNSQTIIIFGLLFPGGQKLKNLEPSPGALDPFVLLWYQDVESLLQTKPKTKIVPEVMKNIWGKPQLLADDIHPNEDGYKQLSKEKFAPALDRAIQDLSSEINKP